MLLPPPAMKIHMPHVFAQGRVVSTLLPSISTSHLHLPSPPPIFTLYEMANSFLAAALFLAPILGAPAPAPQVTIPASFGPDSQISASVQPSTTGYRLEVNVNGYTSATYHGPYTGTPTTVGAAPAPTTLGASIPPQPLNPTATYYNTEGVPLYPMPAPFTPGTIYF